MEAHVYDQFAELQESHFWFIGRRQIFFHLIESALPQNGSGPRRDLDILEVGCGAGGMLKPLSRYGRVVACDFAADAMRYCRARGHRDVVAASGHRLPFADHTFDLIGLFDVIEHIPDDRGVLEECRRVLKPGGKVFISVPAYQFLYSQNDRLVHHQRRYTATRLRKVIEAGGLKPLKVTYFNTFLFPLILAALMVLKAKERFVGLPEEQTNLTHEFSKPVNTTFGLIMSSEKLLLRHIDFPFGHSLIALAG